MVSSPLDSQHWIFDTGATSHMTSNADLFQTFTPVRGNVKLADKTCIPYTGSGTVILQCLVGNGKVFKLRLNRVLLVPDLGKSLFSWRAVKSLGKYVLIDDGILCLKRKSDNICVLETTDRNKAFFLNLSTSDQQASVAESYEFWHSALGHPAPTTLKTTDIYEDGSLIPSIPKDFTCSICQLAKSKHSVPKPVTSKTTQRFELIHSDICGPFPYESLGGSKYFLTLIDDFTRFSKIYFLKTKSQTAPTIQLFITEIERQYDTKVKRLRSDNGGEYVTQELKEFLQSQGIIHEFSPAYSSESNGIAERYNQSIETIARCMMMKVPEHQHLWAEAIGTAAYLKNRLPHAALGGKTPYELFHNKRPTIHHLRPFGSIGFAHIPEDQRPSGSKLLPRATQVILVGYASNSRLFRLYDAENDFIFVSRDVKFPSQTTESSLHQNSQQLTNPTNDTAIPTASSFLNPPPTTSVLIPHAQNETWSYDQWLDWANLNQSACAQLLQDGHKKLNELLQLEIIHPEIRPRGTPYNHPEIPPYYGSTSTDADLPIPQHQVSENTPMPDYLDGPPNSSSSSNQQPTSHEQQVVTRYGRVVNPPGNWWQAPTKPLQDAIDASRNDYVLEDISEQRNEFDESILEAQDETLDPEEPASYNRATTGTDSQMWKSAINAEMDALMRNKTWEVVPRPDNRKIVDSRWVFKIKRLANGEIDKYKARVVAKGFSQIQGIDFDETYAPVVRFDSLRLLLAIAAIQQWKPRQLDVKAAFLYGTLNEEIYMRLPDGYREDGKVAKLKKCIYGLKQSPREWYSRLTTLLKSNNFEITNFDPCVFRHTTKQFLIAVYVDDLSLYGPSGPLMESTISLLKNEFEVTDLGHIHWLLGIQIEFTSRGIELSQSAYIDKVLSRFKMSDCHPTVLPIDPNTRLSMGQPVGSEQTRVYQSMMGSLNYAVTGTRPDLAYTVTYMSQFSSSPSEEHISTAKRILRYLKGTKDLRLIFPWQEAIILEGYSDADFGNCLDTRRSISGNIFRLGNATISWRSKKQKNTATSTCEAEYLALSLATKQFLWLNNALKELNVLPAISAIHCDNKAAIDIATNHRSSDRSKHIDVHFHFVREHVENGTINLLQIPSAQNLADICTKGLPSVTLKKLRNEIFNQN